MEPLGTSPRHPAATARWLAAFVILFMVYQTAEGLQTVLAPQSPLGPALMVAAVLLPWPLGRWLGFRGYDAFGLDMKARSARLVVALMILALLAFLASRAVGSAFEIYTPTDAAPVRFMAVAAATAAFMTFIPSLAEDIITRGFLLEAVPVRLRLVSYTLLSAALYTANHVWRLDWGISEQLRLFCLGLAYGAAAWRWRSLWGAVGLHWGWNLSNTLAAQLMPTEALQVDPARYLSAAAHILILVVVLLLPRWWVTGVRGPGEPPAEA